MALVRIPNDLLSATAILSGALILLGHLRGIDEPRLWIERIERRFAYGVRMRFVGGLLFALSIAAWWATAGGAGLLLPVTRLVLAYLSIAGAAMLVAQNLARHLVIAVAEQNDLSIRLLAGLLVLLGLSLVVLPFVP